MNTFSVQSRCSDPYCDCPACHHINKNNISSKAKQPLPYLAYPAISAAVGAGVAGVKLLKTNSDLNSTIKALNKDTFDVAKDLKLLSTDHVNNVDIYQVVNGKALAGVKKSTQPTKESLLKMADEAKSLLKKSAPKTILKFAAIAVPIGLAYGLVERLSKYYSEADSLLN